MGRFGAGLLASKYGRPAILTAWIGLLAGGVASAFYDMPVLAFALVGLSAPVLEVSLALRKLGSAPFGTIGRWPMARRLIDFAMVIVGILSIDSLFHRIAFPPLILLAGLLLVDRGRVRPWLEPLRDRVVLALAMAAVAAFASAEIAIMLGGLLVLAAKLLSPGPERG